MRFLIVDDDETIHLYLEQLLKDYGQCDAALSGEEGVALFDEAHGNGKPYDAVFMDILMPGMDGHDASEQMRTIERKMGIRPPHLFKLVMITTLVDDSNVSKAFFKAQASCYIVKPLDKMRVLDELKQNMVI